jgi:hypothetical protein
MSDPTPISAPAGYAPAFAFGFADPNANLVLVSGERPMPVAVAAPPAEPLTGTAAVSTVAGPFAATAGRVVTVSLDGEWQGTVRLLRSTDGGVSRSALRVAGATWAEFTTSGCEQAWSETEDGASFYLDISLASGTVVYRVSQ